MLFAKFIKYRERMLNIVRRSTGTDVLHGPAKILKSHFTALALGTVRGTYREVSVAIMYEAGGVNRIIQIQAVCEISNFFSARDVEKDQVDSSIFNTTSRTDCRVTRGLMQVVPGYDPISNCLGE